MALYPYSLQPVALNFTESEFHQAQLELFNQTSQSFSLKNIKMKEWIILAVIVSLAIAGLIFINGYSTILFWLMLAGSVIYLLIRTIGLKWYVKQEFQKQLAGQEMPNEIKNMKLGVQKHGLIMSIPAPAVQSNNKSMRGMQMRSAPTQQAIVPWDAVSSWDETADYIFVMFEVQGQRGSQIIPKRIEKNKFPINTVTQHLKEVIPTPGIDSNAMMP